MIVGSDLVSKILPITKSNFRLPSASQNITLYITVCYRILSFNSDSFVALSHVDDIYLPFFLHLIVFQFEWQLSLDWFLRVYKWL